jgi:hypothetical protein
MLAPKCLTTLLYTIHVDEIYMGLLKLIISAAMMLFPETRPGPGAMRKIFLDGGLIFSLVLALQQGSIAAHIHTYLLSMQLVCVIQDPGCPSEIMVYACRRGSASFQAKNVRRLVSEFT